MLNNKEKVKTEASQRSFGKVMFCFSVLLIALCLFSLCFGRYRVSISDTVRILMANFIDIEETWTTNAHNAVMLIRLPRIIGAILIGVALALAGGSYQSIFHNPLVSPDLLGVSNGACIGAAIAILLGGTSVIVQSSAFLGGMCAVGLTTLIPRLMKKKSTVTLILSGIIVSGLAGSIMGIIKYIADPESELAEIVYWQMGSLSKLTVDSLPPIAPVIIICSICILALKWRINLLSLGDKEAQSLGVNLKLERGIIIVLSTLLTACSVCVAGTIGWVGLVMPHMARSLVGTDNTRCLPVAAIMSACFMLVIDILARGLTGEELPVSILTGLVGAPVFAVVLARESSVK